MTLLRMQIKGVAVIYSIKNYLFNDTYFAVKVNCACNR